MLLHLLAAFTLASTPSPALRSIGPQPLITKELGTREERMWQMPSLEAEPWQNRRQPMVYFVAELTPDAVYAGVYTDAAFPGTEQPRPRRIYGQIVRVRHTAGVQARYARPKAQPAPLQRVTLPAEVKPEIRSNELDLPVMRYAGVWKEGREYLPGEEHAPGCLHQIQPG